MKRTNFLSDRCQEIVNILYKNSAYLEDIYCSNILKRLEPFANKMDDELSSEEVQKIDQLLENVKKRAPPSIPSPNATSTTNSAQPISLPSPVMQETSRESFWTPFVESIVMSAISGTVYGHVNATLIAQAFGRLDLGKSQVSIQQARDIILQEGSISFKPKQIELLSEHIALRLQAIQNIPLSLAELQQGLVEHCQDKHWHLKRLFDNTKTPIEESYITLSIITSEEYQKKQKKLENVDKAQEPQVVRIFTTDERIPSHEDLFDHKEPIALADMFKKQPSESEPPKKLIVFGRAGIGKSVLCQYLAIRWHQIVAGDFRPSTLDQSLKRKSHAEKEQINWLQNFKVVFWIRLREIPDFLKDIRNDGSLENIINLCCYGGKTDQKKLKNSLEKHKQDSLFILDGFDEISSSLDQIEAIRKLWEILITQRYVIVTSRPIDLPFWQNKKDKSIRRLEIMGFTNENIEAYVNDFMDVDKEKEKPEEEKSADALLKYLKSHPGIWGTAHIPINLEILCWLYKKGNFNPRATTLSELYTEMVHQVTREMSEPKNRDSKKVVKYPDLSKPFSKGSRKITKEISMHFLQALAYESIKRNELLIPTQTIKLVAKQVLKKENLLDNNDKNTLTEKLLESGHHLGFLRPTHEGGQELQEQSHYFIHLSFQEYFAAKYMADSLITIYDSTPDQKELSYLLKCSPIHSALRENRYTPRYQLIWRLTAGLISFEGKEQKSFLVLACFWEQILIDTKKNSQEDIALIVSCLDECLGINDQVDLVKEIPSFRSEIESKASWLKKISVTLTRDTFLPPEKEDWNWFLVLLASCQHFCTLKSVIEIFFDIVKDRTIATEVRMEALEVLSKIPDERKSIVEALQALWKDVTLKSLAHKKIALMLESLGASLSEEECSRKWEKLALEESIAQEQIPGDAELRLGWGYQNGRPGEQDLEEALKRYKLSAEKNYFYAYVNLGFMYLTGQGVAICHKKAQVYFTNSKEKHPYSKLGLFIIDFENSIDKEEMIKSFYEKFPRNYLRDFLKNLEQESNQEACDAQFYMGFIYEQGLGIPKDLIAARNNYQKAVIKKVRLAEVFLKRISQEIEMTRETIEILPYVVSQSLSTSSFLEKIEDDTTGLKNHGQGTVGACEKMIDYEEAKIGIVVVKEEIVPKIVISKQDAVDVEKEGIENGHPLLWQQGQERKNLVNPLEQDQSIMEDTGNKAQKETQIKPTRRGFGCCGRCRCCGNCSVS